MEHEMGATSSDHQRLRILFALVGATAGVLVSMLWFSGNTSEYGQTDIRISLILALTGVAIGGGIGELALWRCQSSSALRRINAVAILSLAGMLGATMGWLAGDMRANNWIEHGVFTRQAALIGGGVGLLIGFVIQAHQLRPLSSKLKS